MSVMQTALEEIIPALSAAGLTEQEIRDVAADTRALMGDGGTFREWMAAMATVIVNLDNPMAERALLLALDETRNRLVMEPSTS